MGEALEQRLRAGDRSAIDRLARDFARSDRSDRSDVLDAVAGAAAGGSLVALELLLRLIDEHRLDRPPIRRVVIAEEDVDDVHQDVLIATTRSITRFRGDAAFTTWLHTIARNCAVDHLRRKRDTVRLHTGLEPGMTGRLSSMIATRGAVDTAIAGLPDAYRAAVVLRDVEQLTYAEIAARLDVEINTVKSRIARGRAMVAAGLDPGPVPDADG